MSLCIRNILIGCICFGLCVGVSTDVWAAKSHGNTQMQRLFKAAPVMARYKEERKGSVTRRKVTNKDSIYTWAVSAFERTPNPFYWNAQKPAYGASSALILPKGGDGFLTIRTSGKGFEELWRDLYTELLNMSIYSGYKALVFQALKEGMKESKFVEENMRLQHQTFVSLLGIYKSVWLPWMDGKNMVSNANVWRVDDPVRFDDWYTVMKSESKLPAYYKKYYRERIKPALDRQRR